LISSTSSCTTLFPYTTRFRSRRRAANRLPGLATHDDRLAECHPLEVTQILGQAPRQGIVAANDAVARHGPDQCDSHLHMATGALIWGWDSYPTSSKSSKR